MPLIDSYLVMCGGDKAQVDILHSFGVRTCHILGYMTTQKGGFSGVYLKKKYLEYNINRQKHYILKVGMLELP